MANKKRAASEIKYCLILHLMRNKLHEHQSCDEKDIFLHIVMYIRLNQTIEKEKTWFHPLAECELEVDSKKDEI